jgi:hypothetical protein
MSPALKNGILLVVLIGALGTAVYMFARGSKESKVDDTQQSQTKWICTKCSKLYSLSAADLEAWRKDPQHSDPKLPGVYKCETCGTFTLVRATKCPQHKEWYPIRDVDTGVTLGCPKCAKEVQ